jgi:hypothetical protein
LLGFTPLVSNYLENVKTYRKRGTGDGKYIFNFLYIVVMRYYLLRQNLARRAV